MNNIKCHSVALFQSTRVLHKVALHCCFALECVCDTYVIYYHKTATYHDKEYFCKASKIRVPEHRVPPETGRRER